MSLPADLASRIVLTAGQPMVEAELHFPGGYVHRVSDIAHTRDGHPFAADITGDVAWEKTLDPKFNDLKFKLQNVDGSYTALFGAYTPPELQQVDVVVYETFADATSRVERWRGKMKVPSSFDRTDIDVEATQLLNSLLEPFNNLCNSPMCPWAEQCRFAGGDRCNYAPPTAGTSKTLIGNRNATDTTFGCDTPSDCYAEGEYLTVDNEIVRVTDVMPGALEVLRAQKGTTAASHSSGARLDHESCDGDFESCKRRGMLHRFGGLKFFVMSGSVTWKEKMFLIFSRKQSAAWQSQSNQGIFGSPWGILYGTSKLTLDPLYVRDTGPVASFFASVGAGPIQGLLSEQSGGHGYILLNGKQHRDYGIFWGNDGEREIQWNNSPYGRQGISYLWFKDPQAVAGGETFEYAQERGQTLSRRAYIGGAFPSDVKIQEEMPTIEGIFKGRKLDMYNDDGSFSWNGYTNNPAWILLDAGVNRDYGAGLALTDFDLPGLYAASVDFAALGIAWNVFIKESMKFPDFVTTLCNSTLSFPTFVNNKLDLTVLKGDMAHSGITLDASVILDGGFSWWEDGPVDRESNSLKIDVTLPDYDYQTSQIVFVDQAHIDSLGGRRRELNLKIAGISSIAQAERVGAFWLNVAKLCRRMDGVKRFKCTYRAMEIEPGMIVTVNTNDEDGLGALDYLVWSVKRLNNDGDYELLCLRWEGAAMFELGGVSYTLPTTGINAGAEPAPVEDLTAVTELIGTDDVRVTVSWSWPTPTAPTPSPHRLYLWIGEREAAPDALFLMTPNGLGRDVTSYQTTFPRRRWKAARVYAAGQSVFGVPSDIRPAPRPDYDVADTLAADVTATATSYTVDGTGNLIAALTAGDLVVLPYDGAKEINRVVAAAGSAVTVEAFGTNRRAFYGTAPVAHSAGNAIYKGEWSAPFVNVDMAGPVMPPTDCRVYDRNRDPALAWNELRFEIPRNDDGTPPKHLHVQLDADGVWIDPTEAPTGADDAWLDEPMPRFVYIPTTYNLDAGAVGKLFVIKEGTTDRVGRYIEAVDENVTLNGQTFDRVTVQGEIPRGAGFHDWAIWNLWYTLQDYQFTVALGDQNLDLAGNKYVAVVTVPAAYTGYARVYLLNEWSTSAPVVAEDESGLPASITTDPANAIDTEPAPLVDNFAVTPEGYTLPDGSQKVVVNISFTQPDPKGTFSHIIIFADRPSEGVPGKEGEVGWVNSPGYYKEIIGEIYEAGTPVILDPSKADADTCFFAVSVNQDGYYPLDWVQNGINQPGGYRFAYCKVLPEDTAPPASASVVATFNPGAGVNVVWDTVAIPDLAEWQVEMRKATTEAGLPAASYVAQSETRSTLHQHFCTQDDNGYWFQFRIRAVDNTGHLGAWAESNAVRAYAGAGLQPVAAPLNFVAAGDWEYRGGVPLCYLTFTWDNPPDPNYGGCEAWLFYPNDAHGELYDRVGYLETPSSKAILPMNGQTVTMRLVPYNRSGIVPDYGVFIQTGAFTLSTATFGETVPPPNITARDGVGRVSIEAMIPAWAGMQKPYTNLSLFISATNNSATAQLVGKWPVGHASGSTERLHFEVPLDALTNIAGGPYTTGTLYYFWAKLESNSGNQSAFSTDTDFSAVFLPGNLTDAGAADFAAGAEVLRIAASDKMIFAGWNEPTVNATTVYASQLQVATASGFAAGTLVEDYVISAKNGSKGVGLAANGTYYVRVRYANNSAAGWSEWFGLKEGGTAYATVRTQADQTGDTGYVDGATYITGYSEDITQQDALRVYFKMSSSATNCATLYNVTALWSDTQSKLSDDTAGYLIASPTLSWLDNDGWISTGATVPQTSWIGKLLQYRYNASPALWISGIITQIDAAGNKVQLNVNWGAAKSSQTGRVITPYWQREGVYFKEVGEDCGWHMEKNVSYYLPPINQFVGGTTVYFRLIPHNVYGPGTAKDFNIANGSKSYNVATYGQGYATDTAPTGTFSSYGGQWFQLPNQTATRQITFSYAQATDKNEKADAFVVVVKTDGGTPDPAVDQKYIFPVQHTSGTQAYKLDVNGLNPFTTYAFRLYAAKTGASGMILSSSYQSTADTSQSSTDNLALKPKTLTGHIRTESYNSADLTMLHCSGIAEDNFNEYVGLNDATQTTTVAADGTVRLAAPDLDLSAGNIIGGADKPFYLGPAATDGSWRIIRSGNDLVFQRRESGSWVTKGTFAA